MVDAGVETQFIDHVSAFFCAASKANDTAAFDFGDLTDDRTYRSTGGSDHDGVARFGLADVEQPHIGRKAGHAEHAQGERWLSQVGIEPDQVVGVGKREFLPAGVGQYEIAHSIPGMLRGLDTGDHRADHHLANADCGCIRSGVAHPAAHIGIERKIESAQQDLARGGHRHRSALCAEVVRRWCAIRA